MLSFFSVAFLYYVRARAVCCTQHGQPCFFRIGSSNSPPLLPLPPAPGVLARCYAFQDSWVIEQTAIPTAALYCAAAHPPPQPRPARFSLRNSPSCLPPPFPPATPARPPFTFARLLGRALGAGMPAPPHTARCCVPARSPLSISSLSPYKTLLIKSLFVCATLSSCEVGFGFERVDIVTSCCGGQVVESPRPLRAAKARPVDVSRVA